MAGHRLPTSGQTVTAPRRIEAVTDVIIVASGLKPKTVAVSGGDRVGDLQLVESARDQGLVDRILLVGNQERIRRAAEQVGFDFPQEDIIATSGDEETAAVTVEIARRGEADIVLKANIPTPLLNREMLKIRTRPTISMVTLFDADPIADGRPLLLTDSGFTTVCNFGRLVGLIDNAVDVARLVLGIARPRVAVLSANERKIESLSSTLLADALAQRHWEDAEVYGPLSFDLATDPDSVAAKGLLRDFPRSEGVAGKADILVCPSLDSANVLYKVLLANAKYGQATIASVVAGLLCPYVIVSRSDLVDTKLASIALCCVYAERRAEAARRSARRRAVAKPEVEPSWRVLVVNPGSTSTKVALYQNHECLKEREVVHAETSCLRSDRLLAEAERRLQLVEQFLAEEDVGSVQAVVGRGGLLPRRGQKLASGVYEIARVEDGEVMIRADMVRAICEQPEMDHASNLGIPMAAKLAQRLRVPAFTADPVVVDEFSPEAEISGYAGIERRSVSHALSVKAAARKAAESVGRPLEAINLVVAHLGGGITVAAVKEGRIVDNNIALLGEGPCTPQRTGSLPLLGLIDLCYSGRFSREELIEELTKRGGLYSYLGTDRMEQIESRLAASDARAQQVVDAMVYQIAKEVGAMYAALGGLVEAIVVTGGMAKSEAILSRLRRWIANLAPLLVFPGSLEMEAMARAACRVLAGQEPLLQYQPPVAEVG